MSHDDFEVEPVPGLPANLPEGEHIVWQGSPDKKTFAHSILHTRKIMFYFGILAIWNLGTALYDGRSLYDAFFTITTLLIGGAVVLGLIMWYSRAIERTTIYTITNRRVVMRFGIALPVTFNYPFAQIETANVKPVNDNAGIITLGLKEHTKISWLILWPHVRPWKLAKPEPAMRVINDVENVAKLLSGQLHAFHNIEQKAAQKNTNHKASKSIASPTFNKQTA